MAYDPRGTVDDISLGRTRYSVHSSEAFVAIIPSTVPRRIYAIPGTGYSVPGTLFHQFSQEMPRQKKPTQLTADQYDALERAISDKRKLSVWRRGTEFILVVDRLRVTGGREALEAHHPTTGDRLTLYIDELEGIEVVR